MRKSNLKANHQCFLPDDSFYLVFYWVLLWFCVLVQLEAFLTQRVTEMGEEGDVVAMSQFQLAPSIIQSQTQEHIQELLSQVQDLLGRLTSLRMQHLFMIQASPR